jgi:C4-dicarboxylate-specific signal transduction histidine kinase
LTRGLRFFGVVTASLSHEINNALAVINELSGLISDLAAAAEQGKVLDPQRVRQVAGRIAVRVEDGKKFVRQLNRFAHVTDQASATLDAGEALGHVAELCERFARMQKVELSVQAERAPALQGSPFDLQHVLFRTLEVALGMTAAGSTLTVALAAAGGCCVVRCSGLRREPCAPETTARLEFLRVFAESVGGGLTTDAQAPPHSLLELSLPARLSPLPGFERVTSVKEV